MSQVLFLILQEFLKYQLSYHIRIYLLEILLLYMKKYDFRQVY